MQAVYAVANIQHQALMAHQFLIEEQRLTALSTIQALAIDALANIGGFEKIVDWQFKVRGLEPVD